MSQPDQLVIFGASGDLAARKLIPALLMNFAEGAFSRPVQVVGVSRSSLSSEQWRNKLSQFIPDKLKDSWEVFQEQIHYVASDAAKPEHGEKLRKDLDNLWKQVGGSPATAGRLFYLSLKPSLFAPVCENLCAQGMLHCHPGEERAWRRVVVEKPFGTDLPSAQHLNRSLLEWLREDQIFRIDHYLGKETVQNLLALRFQNAIFEPIWNRKHVESVEISVCETVAMEGKRGAYYDTAGALRDMVQNHLMQVLTLVAMEPPASTRPDAVRSAKVQVIESLRTFTPDEVVKNVVRAQYIKGETRDRSYREEEGVAAHSRTETYVAIRALIDNWRWSGVPFLLRSGKALSKRYTEVILRFRTPPVDLLNGTHAAGAHMLRPNSMRILIQPEEGVRLSFLVKQPGAGMVMRHAELGFDYSDLQAGESPPAYQRLLLDALEGNPTLFLRGDEVEAAWSFVDAIRAGWEEKDPSVHRYPAGTMGPEAANDLFRGTEGTWGTGHK